MPRIMAAVTGMFSGGEEAISETLSQEVSNPIEGARVLADWLEELAKEMRAGLDEVMKEQGIATD